jgi:uncharacterized protein
MHGLVLYSVGFGAAFGIATLCTPAGVSGAVLLLPFQVSVLGTPSPAVTPTNLLYNVVATPGALVRYWRQGQTGGRLTTVLLLGTLPGVIAGSAIRVELLPGPRAFEIVIAFVLIPLGSWLALHNQPNGESTWVPLSTPVVIGTALVVGVVGGIYGIGGGSILAPLLVGAGRSPKEVAPATLLSTFLTSVVGVATFVVLSTQHHGAIAPDWGIGAALGLGGLVGGYLGALLQRRLPDQLIRRILGLLVTAVGARYAELAAKG